MEFSKYVLDVIKSIDYVEKDHDMSVVSILRKMSVKAPSKTDAHVLDVIAGAITLFYKVKEHSFGPLVIWNDGRRSFALEDLIENDVEILCGVIHITGSSFLRAKFSHIVWLINKDNRYGERAVNGYLEAFGKNFDADKWVKCYEQVRLAYHIGSAMGSKSESFRRTNMIS